MKSCTIIISHYESLQFLSACVRQIRKYCHPEIEQHIIIADQSSEATANQIKEWYSCSADISVVNMQPLWSGYGIDWVMRNADIKTDYVCQIHVDAFPIHKNWLYLPIKLIEENNFSFVGQLHFYTRPNQEKYYYLKNMFFSMSPTFNVARTETYKEMSLEAGFTRFHNRPNSGLTFNNNDWAEWAAADYNARGSDDDVIAFCWEDNHRQHNKLGLAITGMIESAFGRVIEDIVFHFGSCCESIGVEDAMGEKYNLLTGMINKNYDDSLIEEMLNMVIEEPSKSRDVWDGELKQVSPAIEQLNNRIEELKK